MIKELFTSEWFVRLESFDRLLVGFSGGLDSTVLLHVLASYPNLHNKLIAVHVNHGISVHSVLWQEHCSQFCQVFKVPFIAHLVQFNRSANIEEEARIARYDCFSSLLNVQDCLVLAHHRDDQAETLLLQLFRGAGIDGLAAMQEINSFRNAKVARPFLSVFREQLESYATTHELKWIEDESNKNIKYSRNFLRHEIIPLLKDKWPGVINNITKTAIHCQQAKVNLEDLAMQDSPELLLSEATLNIKRLKLLTNARMTNVLRVWLKKNQVQLPSTETFHRLINELIQACPDANPVVSWGVFCVHRYKHTLYIEKKQRKDIPLSVQWFDFPSPLILKESNIYLIAEPAHEGLLIPVNAKIEIKFRKGGELFFWHGQTKQLKKLFQEWQILPWRRNFIPLIYVNDQLAAVVGYAVSDSFYSNNSSTTWQLLDKS